MLGLTDLGGPLWRRAAGYAGITVARGALIVVGTATSRSVPAAALSMAVVGFSVTMISVFGGYLARGSRGTALTLAFVLAVTIEADTVAVGERLAPGSAVTGAVSIVAALLLWPTREHRVLAAPAMSASHSPRCSPPRRAREQASSTRRSPRPGRVDRSAARRPSGHPLPARRTDPSRRRLPLPGRRAVLVDRSVSSPAGRPDPAGRGASSSRSRPMRWGPAPTPMVEPRRSLLHSSRRAMPSWTSCAATSARTWTRVVRPRRSWRWRTASSPTASSPFTLSVIDATLALRRQHDDGAGRSAMFSVSAGPSVEVAGGLDRGSATAGRTRSCSATPCASASASASRSGSPWPATCPHVLGRARHAGPRCARTPSEPASRCCRPWPARSSASWPEDGAHRPCCGSPSRWSPSWPRTTPSAVGFVVGQASFTVFVVVLFNLQQPSGWKTVPHTWSTSPSAAPSACSSA